MALWSHLVKIEQQNNKNNQTWVGLFEKTYYSLLEPKQKHYKITNFWRDICFLKLQKLSESIGVRLDKKTVFNDINNILTHGSLCEVCGYGLRIKGYQLNHFNS